MDRQMENIDWHLSGKVFNKDAILRNLMTKLDLGNLKKLRRLNYTCFLKTKCCWMKRAWVKVRNNRVADNRPLQEFSTFFQQYLVNPSETVIPVRNLYVRLDEIPDCTPEWDTFITVCGPHIKSLEIEISGLEVRYSLSDEEKRFLGRARMLMENVETLHLKLTSDPERCYVNTASILSALFPNKSPLPHLKCLQLSSSRIIKANILTRFPNLRKLVLTKVLRGRDLEIFPGYLANLWTIRTMTRNRIPRVLELRCLDAIGIQKANIESLIGMNFPLDHLALSLKGDVSEVNLANVLDHHGHELISLKLLRCKSRSCTPLWRLQLKTSMAKLNVLELWGNMVTNLNFLSSFPSLMKLKIDYCCFECPYFSGFSKFDPDKPAVFQGDMVANSSVSVEAPNFKLESLQEFVTDCKMSVGSWDRLTKWIPNLRVLEAPIPNNNVLLDVCDRLLRLEKLRLRFGSDIDDDGILSDPVTDQAGNTTFSRGISKLTHLRSFEMEVECGKARLTDMSAELGFLKLKHLGTLKLGFSSVLITEEMETRLSESIGHFEMYRSCSKTSRGGRARRCCKWADYKRDWCFMKSPAGIKLSRIRQP